MASSENEIGAPASTIDTPALLVDLDVMEANIQRVAQRCRAQGVGWRPHVKGIRVPALAARLVAAGAIGVTCAKLGEAEAMAASGISSILIANQIVGERKIERLVDLACHAEVITAVDNVEQVRMLAEAAGKGRVLLKVVIEVEVGMARAGTAPGMPTVELARAIVAAPALRFAGLMAWEGHTTRIENQADKAAAVRAAVEVLVGTADLCRAEGIPVGIVSCGGSSTYLTTTTIPGVTEVQAGGGIFSDISARTQFRIDHPCALTVLTTVISRPTLDRIVCDTGRRSMSGDIAMPQPLNVERVRRLRLSAEHCAIDLEMPNRTIAIGDKIEFIVGYADTTVHLHDRLYGVRSGRVEAVWPVGARGMIR